MANLASDPQFKVYVICCVVLSLQMLFLAGFTAARRSKVGRFINPEDAKVSFQGATMVEGAEHPEVARIQRAHRNLLESLPLFYALGLTAVLAGGSPLGVKICLGAFTGARFLHMIVYLNGLQPWRTMMYAIGALSLVGLAVLSLLPILG
jgi:microsomal prostaglandin-E synthase 1